MPAKDRLTHRQEAFAQHVARGERLAEAYRLAGYNATGNHVYEGATRLAQLAKVVQRVDQVKAKAQQMRDYAMASTLIVTASTITDMLARTYDAATRDKQHGAAATAAMGLAKVHGLLVDKTEDVTRRAARSPDAPIEIDVEHWLTEQTSLPAPANGTQDEPAQPGTESDHQSPDHVVVPGMGDIHTVTPSDQSPQGSEPLQGSEKSHEVQRKGEQYQ